MISPYPPEINGVGEYSELCVNEMLSLDHQLVIHVIANHSTVAKADPPNGQSRVFVHRIWRSSRLSSPIKAFLKILQIRPHIVHLHYGLAADYGGIIGEPLLPLLALLNLAGFPVVTTLHSVWNSHDLRQRVIERGHRAILTFIIQSYVSFLTRALLRFSSIVIMPVLETQTGLLDSFAKSSSLPKAKLVETYHGCPQTKMYGVTSAAPRATLAKSRTILFFGFIRRNKGVHDALEAFRLLVSAGSDADLRMVIAGPAATKEDRAYVLELLRLASKLDISNRVFFRVGFFSREEIGQFFQDAGLLVLPYLRRVGPSGPLCLAASFGLPVIATRDDKYLKSDLGGFVRLIDVSDVSNLQRAMAETILRAPMTKYMSDRAHDYAEEHPLRLSALVVLEEYSKLLKQIGKRGSYPRNNSKSSNKDAFVSVFAS